MSLDEAPVKEIAVLLGQDGRTAALDRAEKIVVYHRERGTWRPVREAKASLGECQGLAELRSRMNGLIGFLDQCRLLVASSATGVPFYELEKAHRTIWEVQGRPEDFLEQVWAEDEWELMTMPVPQSTVVPTPVEQAPGRYTISIREVQKCRPELSSKKVLQEFVLKGDFQTLEVLCDHVPPWIELEAQRGRFAMETERRGKNEVLVRLTK